jgi:glycerophosphoryl diester phosphodiesterase
VIEGFQQLADGVEVDIRLTLDNKIVCHHDKSALRTTGIDRKIEDMSLEEIQSLDCGSWFGEHWSDERIPELKDVLKSVPKDKEIYIEVKTKEETVPFLLRDIDEQELSIDQITVITFFPEVIREIKRRDANIKCNLLIAFDYKDIAVDEIIDLAVKIDANGLGAQNHKRLNRQFIQSLKNTGKSVHVWTVNSRKEAEEYLKNGIDSITTNKPLYLRNHLEQVELI